MTAAEPEPGAAPAAGAVDGWHDDELAVALRQHPIWQQDNVMLHSVGIDVGTSGTQVAFSRLHLRRDGASLTSRYTVVDRQRLFQSPVALTPYASEQRIDGDGLATIVSEAYRLAHRHPDDIDTGAVILTGEALRRDNARTICDALAVSGGELLCASAGDHMEARMAAQGSGAVRLSRERGARILNVDIGGGTTKLALAENGVVVRTAAFDVGGRLHVFDDGRIARLAPTGLVHVERAGLTWIPGAPVQPDDLDRVAAVMADALITAITVCPLPDDVLALFRTDPLGEIGDLDAITFSGGVAEYVYAREDREFGDLGARLGVAVRARLEAGAVPAPLLQPAECIRATVIGVSEYTVQVSGNTSYISNPEDLLPRRNLQVVRPDCRLENGVDPAAVAAAVRGHLEAFDLDTTQADFALALSWEGPPSYERVAALAQGIADGLGGRLERRRPLYLVLDRDIALTLGSLLHEEAHVRSGLVVLDGISVHDFDYLDLGRVREPSGTVPVTVKSLAFGG